MFNCHCSHVYDLKHIYPPCGYYRLHFSNHAKLVGAPRLCRSANFTCMTGRYEKQWNALLCGLYEHCLGMLPDKDFIPY